jgi:hypothetical protein
MKYEPSMICRYRGERVFFFVSSREEEWDSGRSKKILNAERKRDIHQC